MIAGKKKSPLKKVEAGKKVETKKTETKEERPKTEPKVWQKVQTAEGWRRTVLKKSKEK
jgi:hypothetical protein